VENLDLIIKVIFVQIVAIELQRLLSHLSEIRKVMDSKLNLFLSPKSVQVVADSNLRRILNQNEVPLMDRQL
jgi:hypothetical protein